MCGISGFYSAERVSASKLLLSMNNALVHRGPDDGGLWLSEDGAAGLGHRRLSIIDLSPSGSQPMRSGSGRFTAVFNGEIYNFRELKDQLFLIGHRFKGTSDTEVMLAAFDEWGIRGALEKLNGMFAAAVWDGNKGTLSLFRDRLGVKPLYYQWCGRTLYFSSELTKPFADLGGKVIDREALALYCRYNYIPAPRTIYEGIFKLPAGMLALVTRKSAAGGRFEGCEAYWDTRAEVDSILSSRDNSLGMDEAVEIVESELDRSVRQHMISDVPLGAFLSGGIDSSLVVAHMQRSGSAPVRTFTIGFRENFCDESNFARRISQYLGTEHTELVVTEKDALDVIPELPAMYGEPFADSSQIPTFLVSKLTRRNITVALSGDGGDELFAGYHSYAKLVRVQRYFSALPPSVYALGAGLLKLRPLSWGASKVFGDQYYEWFFNALRLFSGKREGWIDSGAHSSFSVPERMVLGVKPGTSVVPFYRCNGNIVEQKMVDDLMRYLPDDILTKVDRASMAVSLEVRAPFTDDFELLRTAWRIPFRLKSGKEGGKLVLKKALAKHLPLELFDRPKMGFGVPLGKWVDGPLKDWVRDMLDIERIKKEGYLDPAVVKELLSIGGKSEWYAYKIWAVCVFENWFRSFHKGGYQIEG